MPRRNTILLLLAAGSAGAQEVAFPAWTAAKILDIDDDGEGRSHRRYLYRR